MCLQKELPASTKRSNIYFRQDRNSSCLNLKTLIPRIITYNDHIINIKSEGNIITVSFIKKSDLPGPI